MQGELINASAGWKESAAGEYGLPRPCGTFDAGNMVDLLDSLVASRDVMPLESHCSPVSVMKLGISHPFSDLSRQQNFPLKGQRRRILGLHFSVALAFWWRTSWGNSTWDGGHEWSGSLPAELTTAVVNHLPHFQPKTVCYPYLKIPLGLERLSRQVTFSVKSVGASHSAPQVEACVEPLLERLVAEKPVTTGHGQVAGGVIQCQARFRVWYGMVWFWGFSTA